MTIRGREWMIYTDDGGGRWLIQVDSDYASDSDRGWAERAEEDHDVWPTAWLPREVIGLEDDGRQQRSRIGHTAAPLWTGAATSFVVSGSDGLPHAARVYLYLAERKKPAPPATP